MLKNFMNKKVQEMTIGESIKYSGVMTGIGVVFALIVYGAAYIVMKVKDEI
jgi:cytochrome bd-type quinol oxidase subunit 2